MKKWNAKERQNQIVNLLSDNGTMKITDLAAYFNVSRETIRRDLLTLNKTGDVKKWFGGAISTQEKQDFSIQELDAKMEISTAEKMQICQKALEFIPPHSSIFIDNGSTTLFLANLLKHMSGYTIITASIQVINICMKSDNTLIFCGGVVNPLLMSTVGAPAVDFLKHLKTDIAILGSSGFKLNDGPTLNDFEYSQVKKTAKKNAQTSIVLADSRKATYSSLIQFADWSEIDCLITDSKIDPVVRKKIAESTQIVIADEAEPTAE